jgi:WhiB family redox-sensing transcriptional regulator
MNSGNTKKSKVSQGKLDVYSELELFFPKIPVPDFRGDCKGMPTDWWFPEHAPSGNENEKYESARAICAGCAVKSECLDFAISFPNLQGMWGGMSPRQRVAERRRRYRASLRVKK